MVDAVQRRELIVAGVALVGLVAAQLLLSMAIHGSNYYGVDGKMAQATVLATLNFGNPFDITSISMVQGVGSQMLPKNAWANPAFWPFAVLDKGVATDMSALVALACYASACYVMARCFDVPVVPSAIAAQLCIALFAPLLLIVYTPTNFCLTPGDAVVYAPYMVALGLLVRLQPGSRRDFVLITSAIVALVFYSVYSDPLFTMLAGFSWAVPFAVVVFGSLQRKTIVVRAAAVACCLGLLIITGAAEYLYTLSQYTARVQFAAVVDRTRDPAYVSAMTYSSNMKYFYLACIAGWLLGLMTLRDRARLLVIAGVVAFGALFLYSVIYLLLLNAVWVPPVPIYIEQCLFVLFITAAIAGAWGALRCGALFMSNLLSRHFHVGVRLTAARIGIIATVASLIAVAYIPAMVAQYAKKGAREKAEIFYLPWPDEPELIDFFSKRIGPTPGQPFRGSINFLAVDSDTGDTMTDLWSRGIPTVNEYSQLSTPQSLYFNHKLLKRDVRGHLNRLDMYWSNGQYSESYWKALQMFGVRFSAEHGKPLPSEYNPGFPLITMPYRPSSIGGGKPGFWYVYELPRPNVGDYSPTRVVTANTGAEIMAKVATPGFDFTQQAVLSAAIDKPLVQARDMHFSYVRGGLHVSGKSDGTSLVVLPQQFSNCLRPRDARARLVRANLMMTGMVFSGEIDTDILFDYGILSPSCRRMDLADMKRLDLRIDLRMKHLSGDRLFPDWDVAIDKLRTATKSIR